MYYKILIFALYSLCAFYNVICQDQPKIEKVILPEIKRTGETGYLNCTVSRQGKNKVFWIHKETETTLSSDDKIDLEDQFNKFVDAGYRKYEIRKIVEGDLNTYILIIRRLALTDAGNYTCKIQIAGEQNHPSKNGQMVVLIPPAIIQTKTTQSITAKEGQNVNLTCAASGYPTPNITWMRPNGRQMPYPYEDKFTVKSNILSLKNLGKTARGVYRCIADNAVRPPAMQDANLYVQFAPYAVAVQTSYGQAQNRLYDILLECRISGYPEPTLRWYKWVKDGLQPIADDDKHVIHVLLNHGEVLSMSEFWFQLTIINVQANDYGTYRCEGSNAMGTNGDNVTLYETSECQGPYCVEISPQTSGHQGLFVVKQLWFTLATLLTIAYAFSKL